QSPSELGWALAPAAHRPGASRSLLRPRRGMGHRRVRAKCRRAPLILLHLQAWQALSLRLALRALLLDAHGDDNTSRQDRSETRDLTMHGVGHCRANTDGCPG